MINPQSMNSAVVFKIENLPQSFSFFKKVWRAKILLFYFGLITLKN